MLREKILSSIALLALRRRGVVYGVWALATAVAVALIVVFGIRVDTSRTNMVSEDNAVQARYQAYLREFGSALSVVVVIESKDKAASRAYADELAKALRAESDVVGDVISRMSVAPFRHFGLLYANEDQLRELERVLSALDDAIGKDPADRGDIHIAGMTGLLAKLNALFGRLEEGDTEGLSGLADLSDEPKGDKRDDAFAQVFRTLREAIEHPSFTELSLVRSADAATLDAAGVDDQGYLTARDGELVFLFVEPASSDDQSDYLIRFVGTVQDTVERLRPEGVWAGATGYPAYIAAEMSMLSRDLVVTTAIAVVGVILLFLVAYGSLSATLVVFIPLVCGVLVDLGFTAVTIGRINMLSSGFLAFLVGLGVDFGIHLVARFDESIRQGKGLEEAITDTVVMAGPGVVTGAITTVSAFLATAITEFTGMRELAVISAAGLFFSLLASLTLVPCILAARYERLKRAGKPYPIAKARGRTGRLASIAIGRPAVVLGAAALVTVVMIPAIRPLEFSFELTQFLDPSLPAAAAYHKLEQGDVFSPDYAVSVSNSAREARDRTEQLAARPDLVARVDSAATYLPRDQDKKRALIEGVKRSITALPRVVLGVADAPSKAAFVGELEKTVEYLDVDLPLTLRMHDKADLLPGVALAAAEARKTLEVARALPDDVLSRRLQNVDRRVGGILGAVQDFARSDKVAMGPDDLPPEIRDAMFQRTGEKERYLVRIFPRGSMADPVFMDAFNAHVMAVDPDVTGIPVTFLAWGVLLRDGLQSSALYAALVIMLLLWWDFRRVRDVAMALAPLLLGLAWMVGGMNLFGIGYNFANVISIPLILGIGIDSGVHIVHRYRQGTLPTELPGTTGKAVVVSSLTTILGFGSLLASRHRGLQSLGLTLTIGVAACMVTATLVLPALLELLRRRRLGAPRLDA